MPEHTRRGTGLKGVLRSVKAFAQRKAEKRRLRLNPKSKLRATTVEELVDLMEKSFDEPVFSGDKERLEFFYHTLSSYESDIAELNEEIDKETDEDKKQELIDARDELEEMHERLGQAIALYKTKHMSEEEKAALTEISEQVEALAGYYRDFLAIVYKTNDMYENKKLDDRVEIEGLIGEVITLNNKISAAKIKLAEKVAAYNARFSTIDSSVLRQDTVITEDLLQSCYERTLRNQKKATNPDQIGAFRNLLTHIHKIYVQYYGNLKANNAITEIEERVKEELKRARGDAPDHGPETTTPPAPGRDDSRSTTPPAAPASGRDDSRSTTPPAAPAPGRDDSRSTTPPAAPASGRDDSRSTTPPAAPASGRDDSRSTTPPAAPAPGRDDGRSTTPPAGPRPDPATHAAPTDTSEEYKKLKAEYIATVMLINKIVVDIEQINEQENSYIAGKLYTGKDQIAELIKQEKQAKEYQERVFDLKVKLSDMDYNYFMKFNKILSLDSEIKGLEINNVKYNGKLDDFVNTYNAVIAEKYQEIVNCNERYKTAKTDAEKQAIVEEVNKKLEFVSYIKSMISRRLLSERQMNNKFDIIGYMKDHMVPVPDGFTRTEEAPSRTDGPDTPAPTTPPAGPDSSKPTRRARRRPLPAEGPDVPASTTPSEPDHSESTTPPERSTRKPYSGPSVPAATIIGMKLEIRQVQKIEKDKAVAVEGLYTVERVKDKLRIMFKTELVNQLKALKAKINIEAQTKDGKRVPVVHANANTWTIDNPDEVATASIDIVPSDEQHTMGK